MLFVQDKTQRRRSVLFLSKSKTDILRYISFANNNSIISELGIHDEYYDCESRNIYEDNHNVCNDFGDLNIVSCAEIKALSSNESFRSNDGNTDQISEVFVLDHDAHNMIGHYLNAIICVRNNNLKGSNYVTHSYVLNYDLNTREIIHHYKLEYDKINTTIFFDKKNINTKKTTYTCAFNHYFKQIHQQCMFKRRVV